MSDELENELEMAMNDLLLLGARLEWSSSGAESLEIQAEIDDTKSVIAASLRARPQEPELSKEWLDELIEELMSNQHGRAESTLKTWRLLLQHFRDSILSYAPPPCNLDGDGYCSTHASWRCFPNLGEVAGVKTSASPAPSVGELEAVNEQLERECRDWINLYEGALKDAGDALAALTSARETFLSIVLTPSKSSCPEAHAMARTADDAANSLSAFPTVRASVGECPTNHTCMDNYDEDGEMTTILWSDDAIDYEYCPDCGTNLRALAVPLREERE